MSPSATTGRDIMQAKRNQTVEEDLQNILNNGGNVWVIGDVHGYAETLMSLLDRLNLDSLDRVVLLGDLIDRGPNSAEVIKIAREDPRIFSVLGNHEQMMLANFDPQNLEHFNNEQSAWLYNGGRATVQSYIDEFSDDSGNLDTYQLVKRSARDLAWLDSLPHHIVLDEFRLVHAGYSPYDGDPDLQSTDTLLWIRRDLYSFSFSILLYGRS